MYSYAWRCWSCCCESQTKCSQLKRPAEMISSPSITSAAHACAWPYSLIASSIAITSMRWEEGTADADGELQGVPAVLFAIVAPGAGSKIYPAVFAESDASSMLPTP